MRNNNHILADPMAQSKAGSLEDRFIEAVREMRTAQRTFFGTRGPQHAAEHHAALIDSRRLEREVDAMLERMNPPVDNNLFAE